MMKTILNLILLFILLLQTAHSQQENKKIKFTNTEDIKLLIFGKEYADLAFKPHDIMQLHMTVISNIKNIEYIEVDDQFANNCLCVGVGTVCPKLIAKFNFRKESNINKLSFRMRFPCKVYKLKQMRISLVVKLKTYSGKYFKREYIIPIIITGVAQT